MRSRTLGCLLPSWLCAELSQPPRTRPEVTCHRHHFMVSRGKDAFEIFYYRLSAICRASRIPRPARCPRSRQPAAGDRVFAEPFANGAALPKPNVRHTLAAGVLFSVEREDTEAAILLFTIVAHRCESGEFDFREGLPRCRYAIWQAPRARSGC